MGADDAPTRSVLSCPDGPAVTALSQPRRTRLALLAAGSAFVIALVFFAAINRLGSGADRSVSADPEPSATARPRDTAGRIANLQTVLRSRPGDAALWARLGQAYYQRVRETGDFSYYTRAVAVLDTAQHLDPRNVDALVGLATVALARHDFRGGLALARQAQQLGPLQLAWYPALIDGLVETGQYPAAGDALQHFEGQNPGLASYARVSYFRELNGDLAGATQAMTLAISAGGAVPENVAYVQTLLGDLEFMQGHLAAAQRSYRLALASVARYPLAGAGLASVQAAEGLYGPATLGLRQVVDQLPLPQFIVALGETELAAGRPVQARSDFALIGAEERLLAANGVNTDVDLALYEANHGDPHRAVVLGRRAWAQAPSVRSADALGWALTASANPREGLGWAHRALALGSVDPNFLYHAGIAARDSGHREEARADLRAALSRNPRFSPLYGPRAQRALQALP